jgi:hypothetical protein
MQGETESFEKLSGSEHDFFGVDANSFKLDDMVWCAIEDACDGYRSYLGSIEETKPEGLIFISSPLARVRIERYEQSTDEGFRLIDVSDGHCWLRVGTDNTDDYYPYFVFEYAPKPG